MMFLFSGGRSGGRHRGAGLLVGPEGLGTGADSAVESGSVELRCFMGSGALVEQYGFSAIPRGDKGFPYAQANFLCKGGSELHKVPRGSERPLAAKRQTGISSARPTGDGFCPRSGCLPAAGAVLRPCCSFASKGVGPKRIQGARPQNVEAQPACFACLRSGWRGACFSPASGMTARVYRCD